MKLGHILLLAGAGTGLYYFRNQIRSAKNVSFQFDTIGLTSVNKRGIKGYIKLKLFNPDKGVITVRQIAGTVAVENTKAVNFSSDTEARLQPNTTITAVVNFEISFLNLAFAAIPIIQKIANQEALTFKVNGFIDTNIGRVNFNQVFNTKRQ